MSGEKYTYTKHNLPEEEKTEYSRINYFIVKDEVNNILRPSKPLFRFILN